MRSRITDIENDLAVLDVLMRHADSIDRSINDDMGRVTVVGHPFVHRSAFCFFPGTKLTTLLRSI
jgi:hypothetical protein